jgi:hypothetical protein
VDPGTGERVDEQESRPDSARVVDRLRAAGLSPDRIAMRLGAGAIRVDGAPVTDLEQPAPPPARVVIAGV